MLDVARQGPNVREPEPAGQPCRGQPSGQLQQRQWVAACLSEDLITHPFVEPAGERRLQQRAGVLMAQPSDRPLRQSLQLDRVARFADGKHQGHRFRQESAGHERERLRRHPVEPLCVVDEADERLALRNVGQQAQHRQTHEETVGRLTGTESERSTESVALRARQVFQPVQHRRTQLMQAGERELHLGLHAGRSHDATPGAGRRQVVQQRGLADSRFTTQHQHATVVGSHIVQETVQDLALAAPAEQAVSRITVEHIHRLGASDTRGKVSKPVAGVSSQRQELAGGAASVTAPAARHQHRKPAGRARLLATRKCWCARRRSRSRLFRASSPNSSRSGPISRSAGSRSTAGITRRSASATRCRCGCPATRETCRRSTRSIGGSPSWPRSCRSGSRPDRQGRARLWLPPPMVDLWMAAG